MRVILCSTIAVVFLNDNMLRCILRGNIIYDFHKQSSQTLITHSQPRHLETEVFEISDIKSTSCRSYLTTLSRFLMNLLLDIELSDSDIIIISKLSIWKNYFPDVFPFYLSLSLTQKSNLSTDCNIFIV